MFKYGIYLTQGEHPKTRQYYPLKEPLLVALAHGEADLQNTVQTCAAEWLAKELIYLPKKQKTIIKELLDQLIKDFYKVVHNDFTGLKHFWKGSSNKELVALKNKIDAIEPFNQDELDELEQTGEFDHELEYNYRKEQIAQTMILEQLAKFNIEAFLMVKEINVEKAFVLVSIPFGYNDEWNYSYQRFTEKAGVFLDFEEALQAKKSRTIENFEWFFSEFIDYYINRDIDPKERAESWRRIQNGTLTPDYIAQNVNLEYVEFDVTDVGEKYILDEDVYRSFLTEVYTYGIRLYYKADLKESQNRLYDYLKDYFYTVHPY